MSSSSKSISGIVYVNNSPPPGAKIAKDLLLDVSLRYSVPPGNIVMIGADGSPIPENAIIRDLPPRMTVQILQANGEIANYDTELEFGNNIL